MDYLWQKEALNHIYNSIIHHSRPKIEEDKKKMLTRRILSDERKRERDLFYASTAMDVGI